MVSVTHNKVDTIADWTQPDLDALIAAGQYPAGTTLADIVLPSDWNDDHAFQLGADENFVSDAELASIGTALQTVAVDGVTITGDGTAGNPLVASSAGFTSVNITTNTSVTSADNFKRFYTTGASGSINASFSSISADDEFIFCVRENQTLNLVMDAGMTIQTGPNNISTSGGSAFNNKKGSVIHIWAESPTVLVAQTTLGTWGTT